MRLLAADFATAGMLGAAVSRSSIAMPLRHTQLSRALSHALRHEPWSYQLELDAEGWTSVDDVLAALRSERSAWATLSAADLVEMMTAADKQRFEMQADWIPAAYIDFDIA